MNLKRFVCICLCAITIGLGGVSITYARERIQIVGSSTVFPFSTTVAEQFGRTTSFGTPVVESTGTGGGIKLFCNGIGEQHPDIANASRRIKASELKKCAENGVTDVTEVKIGYDGIVLANAQDASSFEISLRQVFLALAKEVPIDGQMVPNPYRKWRDIDASLPDSDIEVLGPPPTSGTRDAFVELALEGGCKTFESIKSLKITDKNLYKVICHTIREDGAYIEAGENDNLIVQKLVANSTAIGVFGFSFLERNFDKVKGSVINDVPPSFENIVSGAYPVSRSMYFYVKNAHVGIIPGIREFVDEFTSERAWGDFGYLTDKGLIPLMGGERDEWRKLAVTLTPLSM